MKNYSLPSENYVTFTPKKLTELKSAYKKALKGGKEIFSLDGYDYLIGYAKYLIEYLEGKFHGS